MSNELIERLAQEAGMDGDDMRDHPWFVDMVLPRFAALVAEHCATQFEQHADELPSRGPWAEQTPRRIKDKLLICGAFREAAEAAREMFPMPKD